MVMLPVLLLSRLSAIPALYNRLVLCRTSLRVVHMEYIILCLHVLISLQLNWGRVGCFAVCVHVPVCMCMFISWPEEPVTQQRLPLCIWSVSQMCQILYFMCYIGFIRQCLRVCVCVCVHACVCARILTFSNVECVHPL